MGYLKSLVPSQVTKRFQGISEERDQIQMLITQHVEPETAYITITYLDESASFVSASHKEGELEAVALVHSDKTNLTSLNVPPMGLFYLTHCFPEVFLQPPRTWFQYQENILEETWNMDSADGGNMGFLCGKKRTLVS